MSTASSIDQWQSSLIQVQQRPCNPDPQALRYSVQELLLMMVPQVRDWVLGGCNYQPVCSLIELKQEK